MNGNLLGDSYNDYVFSIVGKSYFQDVTFKDFSYQVIYNSGETTISDDSTISFSSISDSSFIQNIGGTFKLLNSTVSSITASVFFFFK